MASDLIVRHTRVVRNALAADSGCDPAAFGTHELTIVPLPKARLDDGVLAAAKTMGTGTVLSVAPRFEVWAHAQAPGVHYHAIQPSFLGKLAVEMTANGSSAAVQGTTLGFTLAEAPETVRLPAGFRLEERGRDWMLSSAGIVAEFDNALEGRDATDVPPVALVLLDEDGHTAAAAGIWDHWPGEELFEIGIDVAREFRGRGLATLLTDASSRWILERERVPIYTCQVSNLRSQRVAASCGFRPLWAWAGLRKEKSG